MKKITTPLIGIILVIAIGVIPAHTQSLSDISGHKYQSEIQELVNIGIINGYSDGTYKPNNVINRAEFLKIVMGAFRNDLGSASNCFPDVKSEWFAKYVCNAKNNNIVQGYPDSYFKPERTVNYVEALKMLYQSNGDKGTNAGSAWYSKYLDDAKTNKIAISSLGTSHLMTRGEIAKLVWDYAQQKNTPLNQIEAEPIVENEVEENNQVNDEYTSTGKAGIDMNYCNTSQISEKAIYVATNGSDSAGNGAQENPYKTVYTALQNTSDGSMVILRGGTYVEPQELRIKVPNVTIKSMPGEWAIIDRSADFERPSIYFHIGSNGSKLQCTEVIGGFYAVSTETKWDWGQADKSGASNILIENNKLHGSGRDVIKIKPNSDNITIRKNEIYGSGKAQSPDNCNAEGIDNVNGDNMLVQDNYIHDTCSTGVYFKGGASNGIVEGNVIENVGAAGIIIGFDTSPEYFDTGVNPGYYENINGIVRNNLIRNAKWAGIALYASKNAQVYNNTIINSASVYHSPIYFGITFQDWVDYAGRPANINPTIKDNVISQESGLDAPMIGIRTSDELGGLSGLESGVNMSGNCYYKEGGQVEFEDDRTQVDQGGWASDWRGSLGEWKGHIGSDSDSIETNPKLNSDYLATGQCAGKGYSK